MAPGVSMVRRGWARRAVITVAAAAAGTVMSPVLPASALTVGDFNYNYYNVSYLDGCKIEMGVVVDSRPYPNYAKIGGTRINCNRKHSVIDALVEEGWTGDNGRTWTYYSNFSNYSAVYNSTGSGTTITGILRSKPFCVGTNFRGVGRWATWVRFRDENIGQWYYSTPSVDPAGC